MGIAVSDGEVQLDDTMARLGIDDVPPSLSQAEQQATVRDLLEARSGIYHPANYETNEMVTRRPARGSHPPGTFWFYNNWDFNALGAIYEHATGTSVFGGFAWQIARPIGMQCRISTPHPARTRVDRRHAIRRIYSTPRPVISPGLGCCSCAWDGGGTSRSFRRRGYRKVRGRTRRPTDAQATAICGGPRSRTSPPVSEHRLELTGRRAMADRLSSSFRPTISWWCTSRGISPIDRTKTACLCPTRLSSWRPFSLLGLVDSWVGASRRDPTDASPMCSGWHVRPRRAEPPDVHRRRKTPG
jgi:CubicO group peptidase (beta-lactamase class C family)